MNFDDNVGDVALDFEGVSTVQKLRAPKARSVSEMPFPIISANVFTNPWDRKCSS